MKQLQNIQNIFYHKCCILIKNPTWTKRVASGEALPCENYQKQSLSSTDTFNIFWVSSQWTWLSWWRRLYLFIMVHLFKALSNASWSKLRTQFVSNITIIWVQLLWRVGGWWCVWCLINVCPVTLLAPGHSPADHRLSGHSAIPCAGSFSIVIML